MCLSPCCPTALLDCYVFNVSKIPGWVSIALLASSPAVAASSGACQALSSDIFAETVAICRKSLMCLISAVMFAAASRYKLLCVQSNILAIRGEVIAMPGCARLLALALCTSHTVAAACAAFGAV